MILNENRLVWVYAIFFGFWLIYYAFMWVYPLFYFAFNQSLCYPNSQVEHPLMVCNSPEMSAITDFWLGWYMPSIAILCIVLVIIFVLDNYVLGKIKNKKKVCIVIAWVIGVLAGFSLGYAGGFSKCFPSY